MIGPQQTYEGIGQPVPFDANGGNGELRLRMEALGEATYGTDWD